MKKGVNSTPVSVRLPNKGLELVSKRAEAVKLSVGLWIKKLVQDEVGYTDYSNDEILSFMMGPDKGGRPKGSKDSYKRHRSKNKRRVASRAK